MLRGYVQRVGEFSVFGHIVLSSWVLYVFFCIWMFGYNNVWLVTRSGFCGMEKVGGAFSGDSRVRYSSTTICTWITTTQIEDLYQAAKHNPDILSIF